MVREAFKIIHIANYLKNYCVYYRQKLMIFVLTSKYLQFVSAGSGKILGIVTVDKSQLCLAESAHGVGQFWQQCIEQGLMALRLCTNTLGVLDGCDHSCP